MREEHTQRIVEMLRCYGDTLARLAPNKMEDVGRAGATLLSAILGYRVCLVAIVDDDEHMEVAGSKGVNEDSLPDRKSWDDLLQQLRRDVDAPTVVRTETLDAGGAELAHRSGLGDVFLVVPMTAVCDHSEERIGLALAAHPPDSAGLETDLTAFDLVVNLITGAVVTCSARIGLLEASKRLKEEITTRKAAQEALQEQANLNQVLLDSLPPVAMLLRPKTREIVACNKAGGDVGAVPGKTCFETWGQSDNPCPWCLAPKLWATGEAQHLQLEGAGRIWDAHWIPVTKDLYLHYAYDITEAKRAEDAARAAHEAAEKADVEMGERVKELRAARSALLNLADDLDRAQASAEAANLAKSEFLANMSHEIRTPMTAILGFAENILDNDLSKSEKLNAIHTIRRNGEHLLATINNILDLSKIEACKMGVEQVVCEPCRIVAEVASLMRVRAEEKRLPFKVEYMGTIPETIRSDPARVRQILISLIGNAIKFTEVGAVRLVTRFVADDRTAQLQFDVIDTGRGMTEEQVTKLFQPFTQADASTTREFGGTGVGLTISKRFAEMLGGDVTVVETQEGVGTRFRVTIATGSLDGVKILDNPMSVTVVTRDACRTATSIDRSGLNGCRILLAEDCPDNQRLIALMLKKAGADVTVEENGKLAAQKALAAMNRKREGDPDHPFDIILMDMQMPVMDGYNATAFLRRNGYTAPIIALTAHAMADDREKCIQAGCNEYLTKPINSRKLIEAITQHL